ncbi:hypothetical protein ES319_A08G178600v1 [Gossypium barbadense]|uniref:Uncharacterized protein n=1 Tax=Gossypium barbadense TaxID=3634 RepID=A0A5J5UTH5_GOSBA|nr:hypothetical protein ES319_A08G178600v1 [Gossypium barbadense]
MGSSEGASMPTNGGWRHARRALSALSWIGLKTEPRNWQQRKKREGPFGSSPSTATNCRIPGVQWPPNRPGNAGVSPQTANRRCQTRVDGGWLARR